MELNEIIKKVTPYVIEMRRYFHENPEKSWNENKTAKRIEEELEKMEIPFVNGHDKIDINGHEKPAKPVI